MKSAQGLQPKLGTPTCSSRTIWISLLICIAAASCGRHTEDSTRGASGQSVPVKLPPIVNTIPVGSLGRTLPQLPNASAAHYQALPWHPIGFHQAGHQLLISVSYASCAHPKGVSVIDSPNSVMIRVLAPRPDGKTPCPEQRYTSFFAVALTQAIGRRQLLRGI